MFWTGLAIGIYVGFGLFPVVQGLSEPEMVGSWRLIYRVPIMLVCWPLLFVAAIFAEFKRSH